MNDYKVGDKVRIKVDAGGYDYISAMDKYRGKVAEIKTVISDSNWRTGKGSYRLRVDGRDIGFTWYDHMLEPAGDNPMPELLTGDIVITSNGWRLLVLKGTVHGDIYRVLDGTKSGTVLTNTSFVGIKKKEVRRARDFTGFVDFYADYDYDCIWKAEEPCKAKELTIAEINKLLGYEVKIVKE